MVKRKRLVAIGFKQASSGRRGIQAWTAAGPGRLNARARPLPPPCHVPPAASGPSLRSVGNGLKLRPESRALRRAPWRRVPTGTPASVGMGYRLLFVYALGSKAFSVRPAIKPSFYAIRKWDQSTRRRKVGPATAPHRPPTDTSCTRAAASAPSSVVCPHIFGRNRPRRAEKPFTFNTAAARDTPKYAY